MKKDFDFDKFDKRMPYTVPDGFFAEMEGQIWEKVKPEKTVVCKPKHSYRRLILRTVTAIAAAIALFYLLDLPLFSPRNDDFAEIELAFGQLSDEDQNFWIETYQNDVFINELK